MEKMSRLEISERMKIIRQELESRFGAEGDARIFRAPGRVDILGSHTDYNEGFILASTIDKDIMAAARLRDDGVLNLYSLNQDLEVRVNLDELEYDREHGWSNYPKGVIYELLKAKVPLKGADLVFHGEVPVGGNLSSSAALEAVTCVSILRMLDHHLPIWEQIHLCRRAENEFVGLPCGIMDQFTVFTGEKDTALFLDCRSLQFEKVPFPTEDILMVVIDSGVGRELVESKYSERRKECEEAVRILKASNQEVNSLRDAAIEMLNASKDELGEVLYSRAIHVLTENQRVTQARDALNEGDIEKLGRIMEKGYRSSKDDFENSIPELDFLHDLCEKIEGVLGTRIAGAGWGGCLVSLVKKGVEEDLKEKLRPEYARKFNREVKVYPIRIGAGPGEVEEK